MDNHEVFQKARRRIVRRLRKRILMMKIRANRLNRLRAERMKMAQELANQLAVCQDQDAIERTMEFLREKKIELPAPE